MKATDQAAAPVGKRRKSGGRWLLAASASAVAVLAAVLITALLPDHKAEAGFAAAPPAATGTHGNGAAQTPATTAMPSVSATATGSAGSTAKPAASSSPGTGAAAGSLAGRIRPGVTYQGVATEYSAGNGDGACLFGPAANMMIAAMNYTDYESAKACGAYVLVRAASGASITVLITNECPLPCAPGQIDLSQQAFAKLAAPSAGRIPITWSLLSPALSGTISIRYKTGSSQYWCGIQVIGHRNPVATLEVRAGGGWRRLPRADYNYFLSADGGGCGGPIRITDIYGQQLTINAIALQPDIAQQTAVQFAEH